ncbi:glycogen/starch/alpha-glucan phosphorylase [Kiritimatiellaeota bacterium B1221]|nr:glycogen/starch/alpha-glucan phosphorylase [Kiritimatiellaeota bacterium B1221]
MTDTTIPVKIKPCNEMTVDEIRELILYHLRFSQATTQSLATKTDWRKAVSEVVNDLLTERLISTQSAHQKNDARRVYYLSLEYLMGRLLDNNLHSAGIHDKMMAALEDLGVNYDDLREDENDMGLGNGGLGRLAACFLDSMATLDLPSIGYGIRYEFGLFRQEFIKGYQIEHPDNWLRFGNIWEIIRPEYAQKIPVYGEVQSVFDDAGRYLPKWINTREVVGVPYDVPIAGFGTETVNFLRLWEARASEDLDLNIFNQGGYVEAVQEKNMSEVISKVLYPNDSTENGKELRLVQQYFFVACSLRDIIRRFKREHSNWDVFPEKATIQLNDTHPAVAVPELMRILHDEEDLSWDHAWSIVTRTFAYTNHTLLPEALERWSVPLFGKVLPRHLQIVFEINKRHMKQVAEKWPGDTQKLKDLSLVEEGSVKHLRMAHLSVISSYSVNGVAALHTELLKKHLFSDFNELFPGRINNKTNGITPRRWLLACNPEYAELISEKIGDEWPRDLMQLDKLSAFADDEAYCERFMDIKLKNKQKLAEIIEKDCGITVDPHALFDVQIKRLHEYKRQHLNLLHILYLYRRLLQEPDFDIAPRVFIFGAKAAPGYDLAKTIIKAINAVGSIINNDERINGKLKVVFLPNYRISLAERIIPAADLSEQISTAGKEASGTGNMKLSLNGALTIGTLDGANIEIKDAVGDENIFIFGKTVEEVEAIWKAGYNPHAIVEKSPMLHALLEWIGSDFFTPGEHNVMLSLKQSLTDHGDPFLVLADFEDYIRAQHEVDAAYKDSKGWARKAVLNAARVGMFSSDRTISEYNDDIWKLDPVEVQEIP